jgi:hypothetical protein
MSPYGSEYHQGRYWAPEFTLTVTLALSLSLSPLRRKGELRLIDNRLKIPHAAHRLSIAFADLGFRVRLLSEQANNPLAICGGQAVRLNYQSVNPDTVRRLRFAVHLTVHNAKLGAEWFATPFS